MGLKFININKSTSTKIISSSPKAGKSTRTLHPKITKQNIAFLRSLKVL
jgi:hypothetical protein